MAHADDVIAIQNLKALYCAAVDRLTNDGTAETFDTLFVPDVIADYGYELLHGAGALAGFLRTAILANSEWRLHMIHSPRILVEGNSASGDWTLMVHLKRPDGAVDVILGRYSDSFRRTPEGWRISHVRFLRQD